MNQENWWNMEDLRIMTVQSNLIWESPEENRSALRQLVNSNEGEVDIIVLPEMFTTGFTMRPEDHAEPFSDKMETVEWMRALASERQAVVVGTVSVREGEGYFNRILWVEPNGKLRHADKRHLFTLGNEHEHYTAGQSRLIADWKGWKINPMCCYDLRFPVWCRNRMIGGKPEYDLQIFMANWPDKRVAHWDKLLLARAIENQANVVGVNIVGNDANDIAHSGHSVVVNAMGEIVARHEDDQSGVLVSILSREHLEQTRRSISFLKDGDEFDIRY